MPLAVNHFLQEAEVAFLDSLRSEYENKGYRFVVHPTRSELPAFFATYEPDAVALGPDHNVAIEVKSRPSHTAEQSLQRIRKLFEGHPDWQLTVAYMGSDASGARSLPVPSRSAVLDRTHEVELLAKEGAIRASFVVAWSLLEAALNAALPEADKRPRTPGTVVQTLAMNGLISEEAEQSLRSLVDVRNRIVHGDLSAEPSSDDVEVVLSAVKSVLI